MPPLTSLAAWEMAEQIRSRKISPVELLEAHLARIEKLNPALNAFVEVDAERARAAARAAEQAVTRGDRLGPLHGVPVTIKSSIEVAGLRCESGTKLRAGYRPPADAPVVARLKAAGAIVLGNTNVPEMLMAYETDNLIQGRTNNPWDPGRTPGGSSGGESAAIAAGLSPCGFGSDGGGSIRVPAHFTGICGLKPTPGRIPATGHFPASYGPFARMGVVGPLARRVRDLELLLEATAGPDLGDVCTAPVPFRRAEAAGIRVGWFEDDGAIPVTPETRAAVRTAAEALRSAGLAVEPYQPSGLEKARRLFRLFFGEAGYPLLKPMMDTPGVEFSPIFRDYMKVLEEHKLPDFSALVEGWVERDQMRVRLLRQMERFPVLLCPVSATPAFRHGERSWTVEGKRIAYLDNFIYCQIGNLLGLPGVVVPVGRSPEGLPIGVQVVGRPFEEELVLAVAARIEEATGGWREPPLVQ